jgi:predicted nuclease of predicted toxin-antitoxin system
MKPRFLADADFNQKIVRGLLRREPAIDFQTASQGGVIGRPDPEVLALAARENRILVSHDRGTMRAHFISFTSTQSSPGLILVSQEIDIGTAIEDLLVIWVASNHEEWRDEIRFIP